MRFGRRYKDHKDPRTTKGKDSGRSDAQEKTAVSRAAAAPQRLVPKILLAQALTFALETGRMPVAWEDPGATGC
jgi:hypothetical protein